MNAIKTWLPVLGAVAAMLGGASVAEEQRFKLMDTDRDGRISREEYQAYLAQQFVLADADGDGVLDPAELRAMRSRHNP